MFVLFEIFLVLEIFNEMSTTAWNGLLLIIPNWIGQFSRVNFLLGLFDFFGGVSHFCLLDADSLAWFDARSDRFHFASMDGKWADAELLLSERLDFWRLHHVVQTVCVFTLNYRSFWKLNFQITTAILIVLTGWLC